MDSVHLTTISSLSYKTYKKDTCFEWHFKEFSGELNENVNNAACSTDYIANETFVSRFFHQIIGKLRQLKTTLNFWTHKKETLCF